MIQELLSFLPFGKRNKALPSMTRSKMLRHTEFYQFEPLKIKKPANPHMAHKIINEYMEDAGAETYTNVGPVAEDYWSLVNPDVPGSETREADYMTFAGSISGSVKLDKPLWLKYVLIAGVLLTFVGGAGLLLLIPAGFYWKYLDKFGRGDVHVLYNGIYQKPTNNMNDWDIEIDVMVSYVSEKPVGGELVKPIYDTIVKGLRDVFTNTSRPARSLPMLYSKKESDFNQRFPIQSQKLIAASRESNES